MRPPVLVTPPSGTPISKDDVKAHLRITDDSKDALIHGLIAAAVGHVDGADGILDRCLMPQTWRQTFDSFCREMRLRLPANEIDSVTYRNDDGQLATVSTDDYALDHDAIGSFVRFKNDFDFPSDLYETGAISIAYDCGYPDAASGEVSNVPAPIRTALILMVADLYRMTSERFELRAEEIDGVGQWQFANPEVMAKATSGVVSMLLKPYRRFL